MTSTSSTTHPIARLLQNRKVRTWDNYNKDDDIRKKMKFFDHISKEQLLFEGSSRDSQTSRDTIRETWATVVRGGMAIKNGVLQRVSAALKTEDEDDEGKGSSSSKDPPPKPEDTGFLPILEGKIGAKLMICPLARVLELKFTPHQLFTAPARAMLMLRKCGFKQDEI